MDYNASLWSYYQPGFVDPLYVPYLRKPVKDPEGNTICVNAWEKQGTIVNPELVRRNWGMTFMRPHATYPCPTGFESRPGGYCSQVELEHEPVFYTDKAFIAKNQYWEGYGAEPLRVQRTHGRTDSVRSPASCEKAPCRRVSDSMDMRSLNPITGKYTVYFQSRPHEPRYQSNPTKDSLLI